MKTIILLIFIFNSIISNSQTRNNFEFYIDSILKLNGIKISNYPSLDTTKKESFFGYWISACFKELKLNPVFDYVFKKDLEKGRTVRVLFQMNNGVIYNVKSGTEKGDKIFNKYVKGYNLGEFIKAFQINGICLYKIDTNFYKDLYEGYFDLPIIYGENVSGCRC